MSGRHSISEKKCPVCGRWFLTYSHSQKTCSTECGKELRRMHIEEKRREIEATRGRDGMFHGTCASCGGTFKSNSPRAKMCAFCTKRANFSLEEKLHWESKMASLNGIRARRAVKAALARRDAEYARNFGAKVAVEAVPDWAGNLRRVETRGHVAGSSARRFPA